VAVPYCCLVQAGVLPSRPHPYPADPRYTALTFTDFLEALGRVADAKSLPTASDLDDAGYSNILQWCARCWGGTGALARQAVQLMAGAELNEGCNTDCGGKPLMRGGSRAPALPVL
jgi:hypothetical protein